MLTIPSIVLYPRGGTLSWLCAMTFSSFRGFWYSPTRIRLHPPKPGTHQLKVVLDLHIALCLSALTESEPHVRTGAQVSCHRHYRSGMGSPQFCILESRITQLSTIGHPWLDSLSLSYRLHIVFNNRSLFRGHGVRKLAACWFLPALILLHTDVLIFNFQAAGPTRGHYHHNTEQ